MAKSKTVLNDGEEDNSPDDKNYPESQSLPDDNDESSNLSASFKQIFRYATGYDYFLAIVGIAGATLASVNWPVVNIIFGNVVDTFVKFENHTRHFTLANISHSEIHYKFMHEIFYWSEITFASFVLFVIGNLFTIYPFQLMAYNLTNRLKRRYFHSIITQEIAWHSKHNSGEFAARIASNFKKFENGFNENLGMLMFNSIGVIVNLLLSFYYGWKLSLAITSLAPIMVLASFGMTKFQSYYQQKELTAYAKASSAAEESISAIRTVFAFNGQYKELKRYESNLLPAMKYGIKRNFVNALGNSINWSVMYVAFAVGLWYGVKLIISPNDQYTIGIIMIIFWSIYTAGYCVTYASPFFESLQIAKTAAKSIIDTIERKSCINSLQNMGRKLSDNYQTTIEFRNVHFTYASRPNVKILNNLNLKINSGETVALVGPSGCGKSTILQLIQRYYDANDGEILIGGINTKELNTGWLRNQLGVVRQEPALFDMSIGENIRLGVPYDRISTVKMDDIKRAATEANAHEFISKLPDKYHTRVGDRGTQLSGGQKQRIAIARALIANPKILLLDEATSALDLKSEHIVQEALDHASKGRTTIIIAHRLSTIINADRIIYIEKGQVVEQGTHEELMKLKEKYYDLVMAQKVDHHPIPTEKHPIADNQNHEFMQKKVSIVTPSNSISDSNDKINRTLTLTLSEKSIHENDGNDYEALKHHQPFPHIRIFKLVWQDNKYNFSIAFLLALLYGLSTPIYAYIFGEFVRLFSFHNVNKEADLILEKTKTYVIYFIILAISIFICCIIQISLFGIVGEKLTKRLRLMAYSAILQQDIEFFDDRNNSPGALCSRLATDAADVQGATGLRISLICQAISTSISSISLGFYYNWRLSLVSLLLMPIVAVASLISGSSYSSQSESQSDSAEQSSKILIEVVNFIRTVVSLHKEQYFLEKFKATLSNNIDSVKTRSFIKALMVSLSLGTQIFAYTIAFLYGGYLISYGLLNSGDFFKIVESIIWGAVVVGQSAVLSSDFTKAKIAAINIFKIIDRKSIELDLKPPSFNSSKERLKGNIALRGVYFSYPTRNNQSILNGLSFKANKGEKVALVGTSGCGKSTTIQLLERFYSSAKGSLLIDNQNIANMNIDWLRAQMALVSQEPILFSYSIRDNIAYGNNFRSSVPFDEIVRAAQMANVHDFIQQLPQKYDTPVGSKGTQLSGGQKQRIAIARALIRDPPILLLDEATSALDTESEAIVQHALDEASKGRTCIIIAHRLKTIVDSDKIVVIHKGVNVEEGTHDELMARQGYYWNLYNSSTSLMVN